MFRPRPDSPNARSIMIARDYLKRQAATLLKLASVARDPERASALAAKAANLQARSMTDETQANAAQPQPSETPARPEQ
jgi:hypothetical protein